MCENVSILDTLLFDTHLISCVNLDVYGAVYPIHPTILLEAEIERKFQAAEKGKGDHLMRI